MLRSAYTFNLYTGDPVATAFGEFNTFGPMFIVGGRWANTQAACTRNTGFGERNFFIDGLGIQNTWFFGWAYQQTNDPADGHFAEPIEVFRLNAGAERLVTFTTRSDRKLDVQMGSGGVVPTNKTFADSEWCYIELVYRVGGACELWVNDVLDLSLTASSGSYPTVITWRWGSLGESGVKWQDIYIGDDVPGGVFDPVDRLGPIRIESWQPALDEEVGTWTVVGPTLRHCDAINEHAPSTTPNTATYLGAPGGTVTELFELGALDTCAGRILAITTHLIAEPIGGDTSALGVVGRLDPTTITSDRNIGAIVTFADPAQLYFQSVIAANPATAARWTDGDVEQALWALSATNRVRVYMFWLEKIVSLRNYSFSCGQLGSYVK